MDTMSENENGEEEEVIIQTDRCQIVKKEDKIVAKCEGSQEVDLGKLEPEQAQDHAQNEECPECAAAIAVGWAVNTVKKLDPTIAKELEEQLKQDPDKIDAEGIMNKCLEVAEKAHDEEVKTTLLDLKDLMHKPLAELEKEAEESGGES